MWLRADGEPMDDGDWDRRPRRAAPRCSGCGSTAAASRGWATAARVITDDHFLLWFNGDGPGEVLLPPAEYADAWDVVVDTGAGAGDREPLDPGTKLPLVSRSVVVLRQHHDAAPEPDWSVAASLAAAAERGQVDESGADESGADEGGA